MTRPPSSLATPGATAPPSPLVPTALQARQEATITAFLDAYNDGRPDDAAAFFSADPQAQFADCDLRQNRQVEVRGRAAIARVLAERAADHDRLTIGRIEFGAISSPTLGVVFARRTNDTLRAQGRPDGVRPFYAAKVIFDDSGTRISTFVTSCD